MGTLIDLIKYIILGIVQGITEVLPVSSSGHVAIFQLIFGIDTDQGILFLILINVGSLFALLIHFRKTLVRLVRNFFLYIFKKDSREKTEEDYLYCWKIVVASIPAGVAGFGFSGIISDFYTENMLLVVGLGLLLTATLLFLVRDKSFVNGKQTVSFRDAITIGVGQMFAIVPGLSRSGVTTTAGLVRKLSMETSLVFSFMLYIPVSVGSFLKYLVEWAQDPAGFDLGFDAANGLQYLYYLFALIASFAATMFSLKFVFKLFRKGQLIYFSIYTFCLGLLSLAFAVLSR